MNAVHLPVLTVSEQKCFNRCPREHHYLFRMGVRPVTVEEPLRFGVLVRAGLSAWWRAAFVGLPREAWLQAAHAELALFEDDPFERVRAEELLTGYHARWASEEFQILGVGLEFDSPLVNPATGASSRTFRLGGTIKALVRRADGAAVVVEHRTTSEDIAEDGDYWRRLRLDAQVSVYFVGARALGHEAASCLYDVVGRVRLQPLEATPEASRKYTKGGALYANQRLEPETVDEYRARVREHIAANPERYFARGEVHRSDESARDAAFDAWQTARAMADARRLERRPRNDQSCVRWGRTCGYFEVCTGAASLEDASKYRKTDAPANDTTEHAA